MKSLKNQFIDVPVGELGGFLNDPQDPTKKKGSYIDLIFSFVGGFLGTPPVNLTTQEMKTREKIQNLILKFASSVNSGEIEAESQFLFDDAYGELIGKLILGAQFPFWHNDFIRFEDDLKAALSEENNDY